MALQDGIEMSEINIELSEKLAMLPHVAAREKFNNPLFTLPFHEGLLYCEGWAVIDFGDGTHLAITHGWNQTSDSQIVDVTATFLKHGMRYVAYFPVRVYTFEQVAEIMEARKKPPFTRLHETQAMRQANKLAHKLDVEANAQTNTK